MGSGLAFLSLPLYRLLLHKMQVAGLHLDTQKKVAIVASPNESKRISTLIIQSGLSIETVGFVSPGEMVHEHFYLGNIQQLREIVIINKIDELIFSSEDISSQEIIKAMLELSNLNIDYKIAPPESLSIIGSNSISTAGDMYVVQINSILKESNRYNKRAFDFVSSLILLLISPLLIWLMPSPTAFWGNVFRVLSGNKSWIGYCSGSNNQLPIIKSGVLSPSSIFPDSISQKRKEELDIAYAKNYNVGNDLSILLKAWKKIGKR
jgi:hypothetical protein